MTTILDAPTDAWLADLEREVLAHPTLSHPLLARLSAGPARSEWAVFGAQHHALVCCFTTYMELSLLSAPDSRQKLWLAKVLIDEYGEGSRGKDHAVLYREWMAQSKVSAHELERTPLAAEIWDFVGAHLEIVRDESYLMGLGALGPGHEWAIPRLFRQLIQGLEASDFAPDERLYFDLHVEQDVQHGAWMTEALRQRATDSPDQVEVRRGALSSLDARGRVWDGILARIEGRETAPSPGNLAALRDAVAWFVRGRAWTSRTRL